MTRKLPFPRILSAWRWQTALRLGIGDQRGQATVEAGIVIALFVVLTMGIIEFGRMWMVSNMITQAAREGARLAAVTPPNNRTSGMINSAYVTGTIKQAIQAQIQNVLDATTAQTLATTDTTVTQTGSGGVCVVQVRINGPVPYIFNLPFVGSSLSFDRQVTFRDEGRGGPC